MFFICRSLLSPTHVEFDFSLDTPVLVVGDTHEVRREEPILWSLAKAADIAGGTIEVRLRY